MSIVKPPATTAAEEVYYPSSDGEPMAEAPIHVQALILLLQAMQDFLAALTDIYIGADMFWYWEEDNPQARRAPDLMVIKGVGRADRRSFFSWRENGAVPCVIVEISEEKTWREDLYEKHRLYAQLGVVEYFLFDPEGQYLRPQLQGFRRNEQGVYISLEADDEDRLKSEQLNLYLRAEGAMLRLIDAATGQLVLTREESVAQEKERVAQKEQELAQQAARIAQLEALLEQAKKKQKPGQ